MEQIRDFWLGYEFKEVVSREASGVVGVTCEIKHAEGMLKITKKGCDSLAGGNDLLTCTFSNICRRAGFAVYDTIDFDTPDIVRQSMIKSVIAISLGRIRLTGD